MRFICAILLSSVDKRIVVDSTVDWQNTFVITISFYGNNRQSTFLLSKFRFLDLLN